MKKLFALKYAIPVASNSNIIIKRSRASEGGQVRVAVTAVNGSAPEGSLHNFCPEG